MNNTTKTVAGLRRRNDNLDRGIAKKKIHIDFLLEGKRIDAEKIAILESERSELIEQLKESNERVAKGEKLIAKYQAPKGGPGGNGVNVKVTRQAPEDAEYDFIIVKRAFWLVVGVAGFILGVYVYV